MRNTTGLLTGQKAEKLKNAFADAERFFWCNTNRDADPPNGNVLEVQMHDREFAAAWTSDRNKKHSFHYTTHMQRVERGDLIFMFAKKIGVIGIGKATGAQLQVLNEDDDDRMRDYEDEGNNAEEWRIPVEWLVWDEQHPCLINPRLRLYGSFLDLTGSKHKQRIQLIRQHYLGIS